MKMFTKLGLPLLAVMISASVTWAQSSNEFGPKKQHKVIASEVQFDLQFNWPVGVGGGEAGIETDGSYIYTTKWNGTDFYRYQMDGTYMESFTCGVASNVRDLAYDGTYFYGAAASTSLFQMDFDAQSTVSTITAATACRALAYNEDLGYFYGNNWGSDITVFDMSGTLVESFPVGPVGDSYYGFAYDNYSGGTYLWGYAQVGATINELVQIDLSTNTETGTFFDVGSVIAVGTGSAGGMAIADGLFPNYYTILGTCQNVSIWGLELCLSGVLPANDVGIQTIVTPVSGVDLGNAEVVTVTVKNYGAEAQSNFTVSYTLDGGTPVEETFTETINSEESIDYTFTAPVDLSAYGTYEFEACTDLVEDVEPTNDCKTKTVENSNPSLCLDGLYVTGCSFGDGLVYWNFAGITADPIACDGVPYAWYHDYTDMVHSLGSGSDYTLTVVAGYGSTYLDVWIDFNDDLFLDEDEHIVNDFFCEYGSTIYEITVTIPGDAVAGQHTMRYRTNWLSGVDGSCDTYSYGNMCDFTADIVPPPCEDFDALTVGGFVADQLGNPWTTWSAAPGTAEDGLVSDLYSVSPSNSILVEGTTDLVRMFAASNLTSGRYSFSHDIYIPTGKTGYWNLQKDVNIGLEWGFQVMYQDDMTMIVDAGDAGAAIVPYVYDTWYHSEIIVDLDHDWCDFYVDGTLIIGYQWTLGTFGTPGANTLGSANLYANPGALLTPPGAHFDDVCFYILPPATYTVSGTMAYANGTVMDYVTVNLDDGTGTVATALSDLTGYFEFNNIPDGTYSLEASNSKAWGGVGVFDALYIQAASAGYDMSSIWADINYLAGDVDSDGAIAVFDALYAKAWAADYSIPDYEIYKYSDVQVIVFGADVVTDYHAICNGDVDESYVPAVQTVANDDCSTAEVVVEITDQPFSTTYATASGEGTCITSADIWYVYTATADGFITVDLCGTVFDTKLAVYDGTCGALNELGCNDDSGFCDAKALQSALEDIPVVNGVSYYIQVGGYSSNTGDGDITITYTAP